jgi:hypothetical protein
MTFVGEVRENNRTRIGDDAPLAAIPIAFAQTLAGCFVFCAISIDTHHADIRYAGSNNFVGRR